MQQHTDTEQLFASYLVDTLWWAEAALLLQETSWKSAKRRWTQAKVRKHSNSKMYCVNSASPSHHNQSLPHHCRLELIQLFGLKLKITTEEPSRSFWRTKSCMTACTQWNAFRYFKDKWTFIVTCNIWWKLKWNNWFEIKFLLQNVQKPLWCSVCITCVTHQ